MHRNKKGLLGQFRLLKIDIPKRVSIKNINLDSLPKEWSDEINFKICQEIATQWLENSESCVMSVPSVIIPLENNYLINPQHPDFRFIKLVSVEEFTFDNRIKST